jgi:2-methylfumaryl-CoA isomerase
LRSPRGRELAAALVTAPGEQAGIFITNLGGTGWSSYDELTRARRDMIVLHLSGTPDGGTAVDYTVNAGIGFPLITGPSDAKRPVNHVLPAWDVAAGLFAAIGILAAERHRRLTGHGQRVDLALSDTALTVADRLGYLAEAQLVDEPRTRLGNDIFGTYGRDFRTRDGRDVVIVAFTPRQWESLVKATGLDREFAVIESRHGVDFRDEGARFRHREEISRLLEEWVAERTFHRVTEALNDNGVVWAPYRTFKELVRDEPRAVRPPSGPLRFSAIPTDYLPRAHEIGADTEQVLHEILGITTNDANALRQDGVID